MIPTEENQVISLKGIDMIRHSRYVYIDIFVTKSLRPNACPQIDRRRWPFLCRIFTIHMIGFIIEYGIIWDLYQGVMDMDQIMGSPQFEEKQVP